MYRNGRNCKWKWLLSVWGKLLNTTQFEQLIDRKSILNPSWCIRFHFPTETVDNRYSTTIWSVTERPEWLSSALPRVLLPEPKLWWKCIQVLGGVVNKFPQPGSTTAFFLFFCSWYWWRKVLPKEGCLGLMEWTRKAFSFRTLNLVAQSRKITGTGNKWFLSIKRWRG